MREAAGLQANRLRPSTFAFAPPLLALALAWWQGPAQDGGTPLALAATGRAEILGLLSVALLVHVIHLLAEELLAPWEALAVAGVAALHPDLAFVARSGLDLGPSMLAIYGAFALALRGRPALAGVAAGLACLLRTADVVVLGLLVLWALANARGSLARLLAGAALPGLIWWIATRQLGGAALALDGPALIAPASSSGQVLYLAARQLFGSGVGLIVGLLAVVGAAAMAPSRAPLLLVPAWILARIAGIALSGGAALSAWALSPLYPGLTLLAGLGLSALFGLRRRHELTIPALGVLGLLLLASTPSFRATHHVEARPGP